MYLFSGLFRRFSWLLKNQAFRAKPVRTIRRILDWEIIQRKGEEINFVYDGCFIVSLRPNEGVSRLTYYFDVSEPDLWQFYDQFLKPGMAVIDIGANIGLHSLSFSRRIGPHGKVIAVEASPGIADRLLQNLDSNRVANVTVEMVALGANSGFVKVCQNRTDSSRSFVSTVTTEEPESGPVVPVSTLDDLFAKYDLNYVDFVKIDVEGFEGQVIQGASNCLKEQKIGVLQLEMDNLSLSRNDTSPERIAKSLRDARYANVVWNTCDRRFHEVGPEFKAYNALFVIKRNIEAARS